MSEKLDPQLHINDTESFTECSLVISSLTIAKGNYIGIARPLSERSVKCSHTCGFH